MKKSAHGSPIIIRKDHKEILHRVNDYSEQDIQEIIFSHPECLPISDIDESYNPLIPVCMELRVSSGALDILMVTPDGDLAIIETKLWRNPEARRKVVAQILDYAKDMATWTYSDLQRETNRRLGTKGNHLYQLVVQHEHQDYLSEEDFCDAVSRNLRNGKFLLLIAGDCIKEGAKSIANFLGAAGYQQFTLAMVELPIYRTSDGTTIIYPRTLVKTVEIDKISVEIPEGLSLVRATDPGLSQNTKRTDPQDDWRKEFYSKFWAELIDEIKFDDPEQTIPDHTVSANLSIYPGPDKYAWISCCFISSSKRVGVYFKFKNVQRGLYLKEMMSVDIDSLKEELPPEVKWYWDKQSSGFDVYLYLDDIYADKNRNTIKDFFHKYMNLFVNIVRPRFSDIE